MFFLYGAEVLEKIPDAGMFGFSKVQVQASYGDLLSEGRTDFIVLSALLNKLWEIQDFKGNLLLKLRNKTIYVDPKGFNASSHESVFVFRTDQSEHLKNILGFEVLYPDVTRMGSVEIIKDKVVAFLEAMKALAAGIKKKQKDKSAGNLILLRELLSESAPNQVPLVSMSLFQKYALMARFPELLKSEGRHNFLMLTAFFTRGWSEAGLNINFTRKDIHIDPKLYPHNPYGAIFVLDHMDGEKKKKLEVKSLDVFKEEKKDFTAHGVKEFLVLMTLISNGLKSRDPKYIPKTTDDLGKLIKGIIDLKEGRAIVFPLAKDTSGKLVFDAQSYIAFFESLIAP